MVVQSGEAFIDGRHYLSDASINVAISTPVATRIDRIVLRRDATAQTVRVVALAGVAGGAMASLTQNATTYEVDLWWVTITSGGVITLTDKRVFLASPGVRGAIDGSTITYDTSSKKIKVSSVTGAMLSALTITSQITNSVSATGSGAGYLGSAASPAIALYATGAGSNEKLWDVHATNTTLAISTYTDANGAGANALVITRSGTAISSIAVGAAMTVAGAITATSAAITAGTTLTATTSLSVGTSAAIGTTMTVGSTLTVTGTGSFGAGNLVANSTAVAIGGTLSVGGATTMAALSTSGDVSLRAGGIQVQAGGTTNNGTLTVTGNTALGASLSVTTNATVGGALSVTSTSTLTGKVTAGDEILSTYAGNASNWGLSVQSTSRMKRFGSW